MPANLAEQFQSKFNIQLDAVLSDIYSGERPNAYLAGFMEFVSEQRSERYMHDLLYEGIARFISIHVWNFPRFRDYPVHFVGSISYYFREVLEEVAFNHKFTVGKTENKPIEPLARYHFNRKYTGNESESLHF
jgi:hypothetical protein